MVPTLRRRCMTLLNLAVLATVLLQQVVVAVDVQQHQQQPDHMEYALDFGEQQQQLGAEPLAFARTQPLGNAIDDDDDNDSSNDAEAYATDGRNSNINNAKRARNSRIYMYRRGCIHRGGACDNRPNDCCFNSSCRCNLWGSNCRCQRMGLFQKWG